MMNATPLGQIPVRPAATVAVLRRVVRADGNGLEVLLLQRAHGHAFGAGAEVFPGGAIEEDDARLARQFGHIDDDGAARVAAIRECFEEAGILVATTGDRPPARSAQDAVRGRLCRGEIDWRAALSALEVQLDLNALVAFSHWITPPGWPRRFSTWFFAAAAPIDAKAASPDGHELIAARWIAPGAALSQAAAGQCRLMRPTQATLDRLSRFAAPDEALRVLAASPMTRLALSSSHVG